MDCTDHSTTQNVDYWAFGWGDDEVVRSVDPFEVQFTLDVASDELALTVGPGLSPPYDTGVEIVRAYPLLRPVDE